MSHGAANENLWTVNDLDAWEPSNPRTPGLEVRGST